MFRLWIFLDRQLTEQPSFDHIGVYRRAALSRNLYILEPHWSLVVARNRTRARFRRLINRSRGSRSRSRSREMDSIVLLAFPPVGPAVCPDKYRDGASPKRFVARILQRTPRKSPDVRLAGRFLLKVYDALSSAPVHLIDNVFTKAVRRLVTSCFEIMCFRENLAERSKRFFTNRDANSARILFLLSLRARTERLGRI